MICVCYRPSRSHTPPPCLQSEATAIIQSPTNSAGLFFGGISIVGGWWFFFCIVLETASLGNWESQTADLMSPHELSPRFHTLTNSHVGDLTHTLPLNHSFFFVSTQSLINCSSSSTAHTALSKQVSCCCRHCCSGPTSLDCCLSRPVTLDHIMSDM